MTEPATEWLSIEQATVDDLKSAIEQITVELAARLGPPGACMLVVSVVRRFLDAMIEDGCQSRPKSR